METVLFWVSAWMISVVILTLIVVVAIPLAIWFLFCIYEVTSYLVMSLFNKIVLAILIISRNHGITNLIFKIFSLIISCLILFGGFRYLSIYPVWVWLFSLFSFLIVYKLLMISYKVTLEEILIKNLMYDQKLPQKINRERVTHLTLNNRGMTKLAPKIGKYINLKQLDMQGNNLTKLPPEIGNLTKLEVLNVSGNYFTELPPEIGNLTKLEVLNISGNYLTKLPPEIGNLTELKELNITSNKLMYLPKNITNLTELKTLNIMHNNLGKLPPEIGNLHNLQNFYIIGNQLKKLPSEIGNLHSLTFLDISENELTELPSEIGNLHNLSSLDISENKLTKLPPEIGNLHNLSSLDIRGNKLTKLPSEIGHLTKLRILKINRNSLSKLPTEISYLQIILTLDISENPLTILPVQIVEMAEKNRIPLNISHEQLATLFADIQQMTKISLYVDNVRLRPKYQKCHPYQWSAEWLLSEKNAAQRRLLIQIIGYDRICQELGAIELDTWQEYTLLEINDRVDVEKICLLKMICPSTGSVYVVRVPPDIESAREAIKWANWGIDPEEFSVQT